MALMNILVTGCAGFIGWKVSEFLLSEGHTVVGVDNLNDAYDMRLKHWRLAQLEGRAGFEFHRLDICHQPALSELFRNLHFDAVINLAAYAGVHQSVENPWVFYEANVIGTLNLLELCKDHNIKKFILASTSALYGAHNPLPFQEDANTDGPLSPYAASKKAAEALCYAYHHLYHLDIIVLRYFTVYGPGGRPDMSIFRFIRWIAEGEPVIVYGDGKQSRDFTYVDDIAKGTIAALNTSFSFPAYQVINLGSDRPVALTEVIRLLERFIGEKAHIEHRPPHPADLPATWANISKAWQLLGWKPETSLEEGLKRTVAWYRENRQWAKDLVLRLGYSREDNKERG